MPYGNGLIEVQSRKCAVCGKLVRAALKEGNKIYLRKKHVFMNREHNIECPVHMRCKPELLARMKEGLADE